MNKTVLLTGATGMFGSYLLRYLIARDDVHLVLIVRGASDESARTRVEAMGDLPNTTEVYAGDLLKPSLGLPADRYTELQNRVTHILHAAASTRFNAPLDEARRDNIETTKNILTFAKECTQLARFGYLSTAFVAGKRRGIIKESDFEHRAGFTNTYQQTKYETEALVRASDVPFAIFRPPFIHASSRADKSHPTFLERLVQLVAAGHIPFVPGTKDSSMEIVDAYESSKIICEIFLKEKLGYDTYHITNGVHGLTVNHFHRMIEQAKGTPILIEYLGDGDEGMERVKQKAGRDPRLQEIYARAESFLSEPGYSKYFDNANTLAEFGSAAQKNPAEMLQEAVHHALWNSST